MIVNYELCYMGCIIDITEKRWEQWSKQSTTANYIGIQFIRPTNLQGEVASVRSMPTETV